jgi:hypothetical protein
MIEALMITITDPSASPSTCRNTPFMFKWAVLVDLAAKFKVMKIILSPLHIPVLVLLPGFKKGRNIKAS